MPITRLNSSQSIVDQLEGTQDLCLITKDALESIIFENAEFQRKQLDINGNIAESLATIASEFSTLTTHVSIFTKGFGDKIDKLTNAVKENNVKISHPPILNMEDQMKQHKTLTEKIVRSELLSKYYDELINESSPFARKEFRIKVNKNASEIDLRHRRQQTIDNVKIEIKIMQERITDFKEKRNAINEKIEQYLQQNEDSREEMTEKLKKEEHRIADVYEKEKLSFMKKTDEEEKKSTTEYLLSFQEEDRNKFDDQRNPYDNQHNQKNYRGQNYKNRRRPFSRDRRAQQEY